MKTARLSPGIVAAIGIVFCLLAVGLIGWFLIKPTLENTAAQQARLTANYADSTDIAQKNALKQVSLAQIKVAQIKTQWKIDEARYMPPYNVANRQLAVRQLTYELGQYLGPDLERQFKAGGVTNTTNVTLPPPPISPNDITAAPLVIPLGPVTVGGDFRRILTHFYKWQSFNRLVLVDGLALDGNSPYMTGTYNATVIIFPQNDGELPAPVVKAGGGAAAGTTPGGYPGGSPSGSPGTFPGGRPGGFPGGRPPGR